MIARASAPCAPICETDLPGCTINAILGLAYDSCSRRLYATDGQVTRSLFVVDPFKCKLKVGGCCKKQISPRYHGLALVPGWTARRFGKPCTVAPCAKCPAMTIQTSGDPTPGNQFGISLQVAPVGATAWLFGKVGGCGPAVSLPRPLCGRIYAFPAMFIFPPLTVTGRPLCGGRAGFTLPVPRSSSVCGVKLCLQWFIACRGRTGSGMGLSRALEFSIVGG